MPTQLTFSTALAVTAIAGLLAFAAATEHQVPRSGGSGAGNGLASEAGGSGVGRLDGYREIQGLNAIAQT